MDALISEVGALGDSLEIIIKTILEVCFCAPVATRLGSTEVSFCGSNTFETAAKKIELLCQLAWVVLVIYVPSYEEFCVKV